MEITSGKSLLEVEKEKLLDPMGMTDTNFFVTEPERLARLAQPVPNDSNFRVGREYRTEVRQKWESASGGMVSTMSDFSKFAQMLANGGTLERSEERRVGKECRSRWSWYQLKKKRKKKEMEK